MKRKKREYTFADVKENDVINLSHAMSLDEKTFYCWGMAWYKLHALGLIDDDTRPTRLARAFVAEYRKEQ